MAIDLNIPLKDQQGKRKPGVAVRDAIKWLNGAVAATAEKPPRRANPQDELDTAKPFTTFAMSSINENSIGQMYLYNYDPKHKLTLPYYDAYPLIFMIELYKDGFLGINLHYLPPVLRAQLLKALLALIPNKRLDKKAKLKVSYQILKGAARYRYFKPCVKRYLWGHVRSGLVRVNPLEWPNAIMLPTERFKKARKDRVWRDSEKKVSGK